MGQTVQRKTCLGAFITKERDCPSISQLGFSGGSGADIERRRKEILPYCSGLGDKEIKVIYIWLIVSTLRTEGYFLNGTVKLAMKNYTFLSK